MATISYSGIPGLPASPANSTLGSISSGGSSGTLAAVIKALRSQVDQYNQMQGERRQEIGTVRGQREDYSKEAAFTDAQGAVNAALRQALEQQMAAINRASAGAGASAGSMRALLAQQAARDAAESAATLGLKTATDYGGIALNASSVLEALTRPDAVGLDALIKALALSKTPASGASGGSRAMKVPTQSKQAGQVGVGKNTSGKNTVGSIQFLPAASNPDASAFFNRPGGILDNARNQGGLVQYGPAVSSNDLTDYYSRLITNQGALGQDPYREYIQENVNQLVP